MKIIMYTGNSCPKCKRAKEMLKNCPVDVELVERNVDENEDHMNDLKNKYSSMTLPTLVINKNEGERYYIGFDENIGKIMEELGL